MSWGADAASEASEGASAAGSGASSMGSAGSSGAGIYGQMAEVGGNSAPATSGFSVDAASNTSTGMGPTVDGANMQTYGTKDPSFMQKAGNTLERFQQGKESNMMDAYDGFGNNPETYGYFAGKIPQGGGGMQPANVTTNINYQQPQNDYLRKRRGY